MVTALAGVSQRRRPERRGHRVRQLRRADGGSDASRSGPSAPVTVDGVRTCRRRASSGTATMPSISGASRWRAADAGRVDEHLDLAPDERVTSRRR